ncbi:beta-lactamase class A [Duganella sp. CF402]|uniref:class A beta-lactamase n=1 Tax=unclassified Duganella TaxID=2636909 RepID=UPI0008AE88DA|nr:MULTISPECIES: class A beta-lactamase [unclassified Duganella]RZT09853.1 beta-lactamase class A [Duganella sp. BK701]SEL40036.1 beta-lactamase class A [Duganella sp. CF402]
MKHFTTRRALMLALVSTPLARAADLLDHAPAAAPQTPAALLAGLEKEYGGRLGVAALNTADGRQVLHRADERFPFCSTFKMMLSAAILSREPALLKKRIKYHKSDLVSYSPVTSKHVADGMTVAELCEATLQISDNAAANLLMKQIGGPAAVTAFARSIGDTEFRQERWETALNTALPGDVRDTTTPLAMAKSLQKLVLGEALPAAARKQLKDWMLGNTTGATRIRAGVPAGWPVADKTGSGDYGTVNDIAVIWPPGKAPIVLAVYTTQPNKDDKTRPEIHGEAAKIVIEAFR